MAQEQRRWYVHDQHDCIDSFETPEAAARHAKWLARSGHPGVHIVYMTELENDQYCASGEIKWGVR
jgi:hypothetical protein